MLELIIGMVFGAVAIYLFVTLKSDCARCKEARKNGDEEGIFNYCGQALCQDNNTA